jgi:hypothetical protein
MFQDPTRPQQKFNNALFQDPIQLTQHQPSAFANDDEFNNHVAHSYYTQNLRKNAFNKLKQNAINEQNDRNYSWPSNFQKLDDFQNIMAEAHYKDNLKNNAFNMLKQNVINNEQDDRLRNVQVEQIEQVEPKQEKISPGKKYIQEQINRLNKKSNLKITNNQDDDINQPKLTNQTQIKKYPPIDLFSLQTTSTSPFKLRYEDIPSLDLNQYKGKKIRFKSVLTPSQNDEPNQPLLLTNEPQISNEELEQYRSQLMDLEIRDLKGMAYDKGFKLSDIRNKSRDELIVDLLNNYRQSTSKKKEITPSQIDEPNKPQLIIEPNIEQAQNEEVRPPDVPQEIQMISQPEEDTNIINTSTENLRLHIKRLNERINAFDDISKLDNLTPNDIKYIATSLKIPFTYNGPNNRNNTTKSKLINDIKSNDEGTYDNIRENLKNLHVYMITELNKRHEVEPGAPKKTGRRTKITF